MIENVASALADYLTGMGFDAGKDFLVNKKEEKEIRKELKQYIENQRQYNDLCDLAEEIDFEGVIEYIQGNFMDDVRKRLFGTKEERRVARKDIISKAIGYSASNTDEAKKKTGKFVADIIDILRNYYRSNIGKGNLFLATEIEDAIIGEVKTSEDKLSKELQKHDKSLKTHIDRMASFSIDSYLDSSQKRDFKIVESKLNVTLRAISSTHPLFPDYKYHFISGENGIQMVSVPTSDEVYQKCPPKIVCKGKVRVGDKYVNKFDENIIDYANRHQLTIAIDINEAKKLLGDVEDPIQLEAVHMIGTTGVIPPKPFPVALPCCIKINGETLYEYIELRTKEILDDGTYIITNEEQENIAIRISINANLVSGQVDVNTRTVNATNMELLQYVRFMKRACEKGKMSIYALSLGKDLMNGCLNDCNYDGGFPTADEEISFLEKIVMLEQFFHKVIKIPDSIYESDMDSIDYMIKLIKKEKVELTWEGKVLTIPITLDNEIKKNFSELEEKLQGITVYGDANVTLFDETYHLPIIRTFENAVIRDLEQVKKKAEVLEEGDTLKIKYIPGISNTLIDLLDESPNRTEK